jgi:hypothetical protein
LPLTPTGKPPGPRATWVDTNASLGPISTVSVTSGSCTSTRSPLASRAARPTTSFTSGERVGKRLSLRRVLTLNERAPWRAASTTRRAPASAMAGTWRGTLTANDTEVTPKTRNTRTSARSRSASGPVARTTARA